MIKNAYVRKLARALESHVEAACADKHPPAIVRRGDKVRKAFRDLDTYLHDHGGSPDDLIAADG